MAFKIAFVDNDSNRGMQEGLAVNEKLSYIQMNKRHPRRDATLE